jgi:hypothetical protein
MTTETDLAYIAGFVDGEGCLRVNDNGSIELAIINTCYETLKFIQDLLGGNLSQRKQRVNKKQYSYRVYGEQAFVAINKLLPYLKEKKTQAVIVLEFFLSRDFYAPIQLPSKKGKHSNPKRKEWILQAQSKLTDLKLCRTYQQEQI